MKSLLFYCIQKEKKKRKAERLPSISRKNVFDNLPRIMVNRLISFIIALMRDLRVQYRMIAVNILPFLLADFLFNISRICSRGVIKNIKCYSIPFPLNLCQNAVFPLTAGFDADIVLCNTPQHIDAFANINNFIILPDAVNARMFIFCG